MFVFFMLVLSMPFICAVDIPATDPNLPLPTGNINDVFSKDFSVPEDYQIPARILFGLNGGEPIELSVFIVLVALLIFTFIFIKSIVSLIDVFGGGFKSWLGALVVTLLISVSGALKISAAFIFAYLGIFKSQTWLSILVIVFVLIIIFWGIIKLLRFLKYKKIIEKRKMRGFKEKLKEEVSKASHSENFEEQATDHGHLGDRSTADEF